MLTHSVWGLGRRRRARRAVPFVVLNGKRTRRMRAFEEQFPEALDLIARDQGRARLRDRLKMVADEMPDPIGPEFRKTFDEQNFGLPLKDALNDLTVRMPLLDVRFFVTAVLIQRETGGNLSEILENLAHVVRERFKILRQVRVYTAQAASPATCCSALPAFLAIALAFINPEHMQLLFPERMGHMMLIGAIVMQTIGYSGSGKSSRSRYSRVDAAAAARVRLRHRCSSPPRPMALMPSRANGDRPPPRGTDPVSGDGRRREPTAFQSMVGIVQAGRREGAALAQGAGQAAPAPGAGRLPPRRSADDLLRHPRRVRAGCCSRVRRPRS